MVVRCMAREGNRRHLEEPGTVETAKDLSGLKLFPNSFGLYQDSAFQHDSGVD